MTIKEVTRFLEEIAPPGLQEDYDNSGLIIGKSSENVKGVLVSLDCIESTVEEAIETGCNLIVSHHPIVFKGLRRFNESNYVERTVQKAIKYDIAVYAIHTNLDNVLQQGVNQHIAGRLKLNKLRILKPRTGNLVKLVTYVPVADTDSLLDALFEAGAGQIGDYSECSFASEGKGSFKGNEHSNPTVGTREKRHYEKENRIEVIVKKAGINKVLDALNMHHPYEEVAYELYPTLNKDPETGSGIIGELKVAMKEDAFLKHLKKNMELDSIRYTTRNAMIKRVAICGGSGSFLISDAKALKADAFVTADIKYHQFFDAEQELTICDIGHYESEKYTIDLLSEVLSKKFTTFAVLKTKRETNPIKYFH